MKKIWNVVQLNYMDKNFIAIVAIVSGLVVIPLYVIENYLLFTNSPYPFIYTKTIRLTLTLISVVVIIVHAVYSSIISRKNYMNQQEKKSQKTLSELEKMVRK